EELRILRAQPGERVAYPASDRNGIRRIEPVMRVAVGMNMCSALDAQARRVRLDQTYTARGVDDDQALGRPQLCDPWLVVKADADQQRCAADACELRRLQFDGVRVLLRRSQTLDVDAGATDRLGQWLQV